MNVLLA